MTKKEFEKLRQNQDLSDLHYPDAKDWMWDYCLFLGKFTDSESKNYDLGVHFNGEQFDKDYFFSDATVFSNEPWCYYSGFLNLDQIVTNNGEKKTKLEFYIERGFESQIECWNRLQKLLQKL